MNTHLPSEFRTAVLTDHVVVQALPTTNLFENARKCRHDMLSMFPLNPNVEQAIYQYV